MPLTKTIVKSANQVITKLIIGIIFSRQIRPWFLKIAERFELGEVSRPRGGLNTDAPRRLVFSRYLPDTSSRLNRLHHIIDGRTVCIISQGPSSKTLEAWIEELRKLDICYFGVDDFMIPEQNILAKINRTYDVVTISSGFKPKNPIANDILEFLARRQKNMFISEAAVINAWAGSLRPTEQETLQNNDEKLLFYASVPEITITIGSSSMGLDYPQAKYPLHFLAQSALFISIYMAIIGGASQVIIFGTDNVETQAFPSHYRYNGVAFGEFPYTGSIALEDQFFNIIIDSTINNIRELMGNKRTQVFNCSTQNGYTALPQINYDAALRLLNSDSRK